MMMCRQCNQQNPDEAQFCHQCGAKLAEATATAGTASETPTAWSVQGDETLWRQFIGPNADHYLTVFKKFSSNGQPKFALSWNWPAFLYISFLWFLYRKMYLHAFVYAVGPMISTYLTGDFSAGIVWSIMAGATANYLYFWHCREHIGEIKKSQPDGSCRTRNRAERIGRGAALCHLGRRVFLYYLPGDTGEDDSRRPARSG